MPSTRREFFQKILRTPEVSPGDVASAQEIEGIQPAEKGKYTRREAVSKIYGFSTWLTAMSTPLAEKAMPAGNQQYQKYKSIPAHLETIGQTTLINVAEVIFATLMKMKGIETGNEGWQSLVYQFERDPKKTIEAAVIHIPALEEALFRLGPDLLLINKDPSKKYWLSAGLPSAALFGLAHNLVRDKNNAFRLGREKIPLPQFFSGLLFWYLMREKGFSHPLLAHASNNGLVSLLLILQYHDLPGLMKPAERFREKPIWRSDKININSNQQTVLDNVIRNQGQHLGYNICSDTWIPKNSNTCSSKAGVMRNAHRGYTVVCAAISAQKNQEFLYNLGSFDESNKNDGIATPPKIHTTGDGNKILVSYEIDGAVHKKEIILPNEVKT